jgi:hypothetical protein
MRSIAALVMLSAACGQPVVPDAGDAQLDTEFDAQTDSTFSAPDGPVRLDAVRADGARRDATSDVPQPPSDVVFDYQIAVSDSRVLMSRGHAAGVVAYNSACPAGQLAVGLSVRAVPQVYSVALRCALLNEDGTLGAITATMPNGGMGGTPFDDDCPSGSVMVRLFGHDGTGLTADALSGVGIGCAPLRTWVSTMATVTQLTERGGTTGTAFSDTCPVGYVVNSMTGTLTMTYANGPRVARVQAHCVRVVR